MSAVSRLPQSDPLYTRPAPERPVYATGVMLDADDFTAEQTYHRGRLAQALAFLSGGGTLAGLRVGHRAPGDGRAEEILVAAGLACDRIGRLVELPRDACLRLSRWWDTQAGDDGGDRLRRASYDRLDRFVSARCATGAGTLPARAVVADIYIRFVACARGYTPSFASGPYDALDAVATSRLRDAYELLMVPRHGLDEDFDGLPAAAFALPEETAGETPAQRREAIGHAMHEAVLDAWPRGGDDVLDGGLAPEAGHPQGVDSTAQFLARVLLPVQAGAVPLRVDGAAVVVDNWSRRFVPSSQLLQRWLTP